MQLFTENLSKVRLPLYLDKSADNINKFNMLKIILIEDGSAIFCIDGNTVVLSAPMIICVNNKEDIYIQKSKELSIRVIFFSPQIINNYYNEQNIYDSINGLPETVRLDHFYFEPFINRKEYHNGLINIGPMTIKKISDIFNSIEAQLINFEDNFWACRNRTFLIELLFLIHHCYSEKETLDLKVSETSNLINDIILYIHLNYNKKLTIEDIVTGFNTNRNTLSRKFKNETGNTVVEYIVKLRIKVACALLKETSIPIEEVMERVGFNDLSYWGRAFKKYVGITPSDYRKTQRYSHPG